MPKKYPFTRFVLPNGLTLLHYKMDSVMSVFAALYVRVGAVYEKPSERGISHFTEHMAFLGTKKYPSPLALSKMAENIGATYNGSTSKYSTYYWVRLPYSNFEKGIDMLYEFAFRQLLEDKSLLEEKGVVLSEYNDFWHNPESRFNHILFERRFRKKAHPYSYRPLGIPKTINSFNKSDVLKWKNTYYNPKNMILVVTGNVDLGTLKSLVAKNFAKEIPSGKYGEPKFPENYSNFLLYKHTDPRPQITFALSFPAFGIKEADRKRRLTLNTLNHIVGGGWASRLFQRLREKERFAYRIRSSRYYLNWMGEFSIYGSTPIEKLVPALKALKDEFSKLTNAGVTQKEIGLANNFLDANTLLQFDNPEAVAHFFGSQELDDEEIWFPEDWIREAHKITKSDLDRMAKGVIDYSRLNIGLLGNVPDKTVKEIEKIFNL